jgi:hypothetical protein
MTPQAAEHMIEVLTREMVSLASQPCRSAAERSERDHRVIQLQAQVENIRAGQFRVGHP